MIANRRALTRGAARERACTRFRELVYGKIHEGCGDYKESKDNSEDSRLQWLCRWLDS